MDPLSLLATSCTCLRRLQWALVLALFSAVNAHANTLLYWNGSAPNGPATGTWSMNASNHAWSTNNDENIANDPGPVNYSAGGTYPIPIFANGNATDGLPGPYTVTVDNSFGQVSITDMHCDVGPVTLTGGKICWSGGTYSGPGYNLISALSGQVFTINCALSNLWNSTDGTAFHKYKPGTLVLGATNTWVNESLMIEGGTVMINVDQSLPSGSGLILANGDGRGSDGFVDTAATFNTGGHTQTLGTLTLTGPDNTIARTIDFNNGHGTLSFANSSAISWVTSNNANNSANPGAIPLLVTNYMLGTTKLRFGTSSGGLTTTQLGLIQFQNYLNLPGVIDTHGYVTPELPIFQSLNISGSSVQITWSNTIAGYTYEVDYRNTLSPSSPWQTLGDYTATGSTVVAHDTYSPPTRYYRMQVISQ